MEALVITVAGLSSRFSESIGKSTLKCIYHEEDPRKTLLRHLLSMAEGRFDKVVIVGGHKLEELRAYVSAWAPIGLKNRISIVVNPFFKERGSGWSLYLGLQELRDDSIDFVTFAEGDLFFDESSFLRVCSAQRDVLTCTDEVIDARRSVAFYCDSGMHPHYIYDTAHGSMRIPESFTRIYNSGQVWRFARVARLFDEIDGFPDERMFGTNLEMINAYYSTMSIDELDIVRFRTWVNCNSIGDYRLAFGGMCDDRNE